MIKIETNEGITRLSCEGNSHILIADLGVLIDTVVNALYNAGVDDAAERAEFIARIACKRAKIKHRNDRREE